MGLLKPWNAGGHTVVLAGFGVIFDAKPPPEVVRELAGLHSRYERDFPRLQIAPADQTQPPAPGELPLLAGFVFDHTLPDSTPGREIKLALIEGGNYGLFVRRWDYADWESTWKRDALGVYGAMLPRILESVGVTKIELRLHHRFVWEGDPKQFRAGMVFRADSPLLTPNVHNANDIWHSHHGFFEFLDEDSRLQLLNSVETSLARPYPGDAGSLLWCDIKVEQALCFGLKTTILAEEATKAGFNPEGKRATDCLDGHVGKMLEKNYRLLEQLVTGEQLGKTGDTRKNNGET